MLPNESKGPCVSTWSLWGQGTAGLPWPDALFLLLGKLLLCLWPPGLSPESDFTFLKAGGFFLLNSDACCQQREVEPAEAAAGPSCSISGDIPISHWVLGSQQAGYGNPKGERASCCTIFESSMSVSTPTPPVSTTVPSAAICPASQPWYQLQ